MNFESIFNVLAPFFVGGFIVHYVHVLWERKSSQLLRSRNLKRPDINA